MFIAAAEERRLAADGHVATEGDRFELFVESVLATCDSNRAAQNALLE
jgi:hypothetical protein